MLPMQNYLRTEGINKLLSTAASIAIRKDYPSYYSLMITPKGSKLKLLGSSVKTEKKGKISVLYLAPEKQAAFWYDDKGNVIKENGKPRLRYNINMCPMAGDCAQSCLAYSGRMPFHLMNRIRKTRAFIGHPMEFLTDLVNDIYIKAQQAFVEGKELYIRLDGTTDNRWERYLDLSAMVRDFAGLAGFYDYTKFPLSARVQSPVHHLTYSVDEKDVSLMRAKEYHNSGYPFAVVVDADDYKKLKKLEGVTDGDDSDMRWLDKGAVVLKAKRLFGAKYTKKGRGLVRTMAQVLELL